MSELANPEQERYAALAAKWFGVRSKGGKLLSVVRDVARYKTDAGQYGSPAQRRKKLDSVARAARKLQPHLTDLDRTSRRLLFGGRLPSSSGGVDLSFEGSANPDALIKLAEFEVLLGELVANAKQALNVTEPGHAGAHVLPDPVTFGVECLASFWRKHRDEEPTTSTKKDGFGAFAEDVLCQAPVEADLSQVRTAVRRLVEKRRQTEDRAIATGGTDG